MKKISKYNKKKAQINQVFVYIVSIIIIGFVGFLVAKFALTFSNDTTTRVDYKIYDYIEKDYIKVYSTFGSEKVKTYRVSKDVGYICFFSNQNCINNYLSKNDSFKPFVEDLNITYSSGDNVALIDTNNQLINSKNLGKFNACFCQKPNNQNIKIILTNENNKVFIKPFEE